MSGQALAQKLPPPGEVVLTVMNGEDRGVGYKLLAEKISLGRAPENDVIVNDAKASRSHAQIERRASGYFVVDLQSKTGIFLNEKPVTEAPIRTGDIIRVGDTNLRFGANAPMAVAMAGSPPPIPHGFPPGPSVNGAAFGGGMSRSAPPTPTPASAARNPFVIVIAIGLIVVIALLTQTQAAKRKRMKIKDEAAYDQQIEGTSEFNERQEQSILEKGKDTQQYGEAQGFYMRGFREFRENNFSRAVEDFEAALALYPSHPLAKRYLERSRLKINEMVTQALERGERDFQLERYMNAFNEYRTVLLLTNDARNKNYQLAQKRIEAIQLILTNNR